MEPDTEKRITQVLFGYLSSLLQHSSELQELAVKWWVYLLLSFHPPLPLALIAVGLCDSLPHLVACCHAAAIEEFAAALGTQLLSGNEYCVSVA
jgi:hypothetical protein